MDRRSALNGWPIPSAPALWITTVGWVLFNDAILVAQGRESMSSWYGRNWWKVDLLAVYLLLHVHARPRALARFDPLHLAAALLRPKVAPQLPQGLDAP